MSGTKRTNRRKQILFAALAAVATGFAAVVIETGVIGQSNQHFAAGQDPIEYGAVYDCGAGKRKFKVLSCEGDEDMDRCKVQTLREALPALEDWWYRKGVMDAIAEGCKPKTNAKKKQGARPQVEPEPEPELEEKPAPKKPAAKPTPKPKPTPEPEPESEDKNEPQKEESPDEPVTTGPEFQLGDCVKVGNSQGIITKTDGEAFYVQTADGTTRVPFSSASKLKKATGCGGG